VLAGKRFGIFYTAAVLSGAFGGILAGAITGHLNGAHGIAGWRWLFIVEGVATIGVAMTAFFVLLDYPGTSKRLTPEERRLASIRIIHDGIATGGHSSKRLTHWQAFLAAVADPRTYMFLVLFMLDVGAGSKFNTYTPPSLDVFDTDNPHIHLLFHPQHMPNHVQGQRQGAVHDGANLRRGRRLSQRARVVV
jgi:MFS family permease